MAALRRSMELWVGCVAGALEAREFLAGAGLDVGALAPHVEGHVMGAFVRASKPAAPAGSSSASGLD